MNWRDWLPGHKPKGPTKLVPPRFIGDASGEKLCFSVYGWDRKLKYDYSLAAPNRKRPWKKLRDVAIASRNVEVVSLLTSEEQGLKVREAMARLPDFNQCVPQRIAEALNEDLLKLVWPAFIGHEEVRLHFFGTAWRTTCGQIMVPRVRLSASGHDFLVPWLEDEGKPVQSIWLQNDFAVIFT